MTDDLVQALDNFASRTKASLNAFPENASKLRYERSVWFNCKSVPLLLECLEIL